MFSCVPAAVHLLSTCLTPLYDPPAPQGDADAFRAFPLQHVVLLPWNNHEDEDAMLHMLQEGEIEALIVDAPFAEYQTSVNCELFEVGCLAGRAPRGQGGGEKRSSAGPPSTRPRYNCEPLQMRGARSGG
jgi:hypothetical protein